MNDDKKEKMTREDFLAGCREALGSEGIEKMLETKKEAVELANELGEHDPVLGMKIHNLIDEAERRLIDIRDYIKRQVESA